MYSVSSAWCVHCIQRHEPLTLLYEDFGRAEAQFERILALDPYRVDDIDVYSNILYVTDNTLKLSQTAQAFVALDRDRPEVCCLVGELFVLL